MRVRDIFAGPLRPYGLAVVPVSEGPTPLGWRIFSIVDGQRGKALDFFRDRLEANRMAADTYAVTFDYKLMATGSRPMLCLAEAPCASA